MTSNAVNFTDVHVYTTLSGPLTIVLVVGPLVRLICSVF